eukprot:COSAG06_NODE_6802_length_2772_cov_1.554807_2_plen_52_part_01
MLLLTHASSKTWLGRFDKIATHTAQPLKHHAVDSAEPFVRGGPGMESLPRF